MKNKNKDIIQDQINIIKDFAKKMGYETEEYNYTHCVNGHLCYSIELIGTSDAGSSPYSWNWDMETGQPIW